MNNQINNKYFFISYSHGNKVIVENDIKYFQEHYYQYWYDSDGLLATDDSWKEKAYEAIFNKNCSGVVFYLSIGSLLSEAVEYEISLIKERIKDKSTDFFYFAVLIDGNSFEQLVKKAYNTIDDFELTKKFPIARIGLISSLFSEEKIYLVHNMNNYYSQFYNSIINYGVINDTLSIEVKLKQNGLLDNNSELLFGVYKTNEISSKVIYKEYDKIDNDYYYLCNGITYVAKKIKWIYLDSDGNTARFISKNIIDFAIGSNLQSWLYNFYNSCFSLDEKQLIDKNEISILSLDDFNYYSLSNKKILDEMNQYWLNTISSFAKNKMLFVNKGKVNSIGINKESLCGIRPIIKIRMVKGNE